jgi:hypothetical protein
VQSARCPDMVAKCEPILNSIYGEDTRGTLMNDIRTLDSNMNDTPEKDNINKWDYDMAKLKPLDEETYKALLAFTTRSDVNGWTPRKDALLHTQCRIRGLQYKRSTSGKRDSVIFFQPTADEPLVPAIIRQIFSQPRVNSDGIETQCLLLAVQRYKPLVEADCIHDPFNRFADFGTNLWHDATAKVEIIEPAQKICHAIHRRWNDKIVVMRPLNRVSNLINKIDLRRNAELTDRTFNTCDARNYMIFGGIVA